MTDISSLIAYYDHLVAFAAKKHPESDCYPYPKPTDEFITHYKSDIVRMKTLSNGFAMLPEELRGELLKFIYMSDTLLWFHTLQLRSESLGVMPRIGILEGDTYVSIDSSGLKEKIKRYPIPIAPCHLTRLLEQYCDYDGVYENILVPFIHEGCKYGNVLGMVYQYPEDTICRFIEAHAGNMLYDMFDAVCDLIRKCLTRTLLIDNEVMCKYVGGYLVLLTYDDEDHSAGHSVTEADDEIVRDYLDKINDTYEDLVSNICQSLCKIENVDSRIVSAVNATKPFRYLYCTNDNICACIDSGNIRLLDVLIHRRGRYQKKVYPTKQLVQDVLERGSYNVIQYIRDIGMLDMDEIVNEDILKMNKQAFIWLLTKYKPRNYLSNFGLSDEVIEDVTKNIHKNKFHFRCLLRWHLKRYWNGKSNKLRQLLTSCTRIGHSKVTRMYILCTNFIPDTIWRYIPRDVLYELVDLKNTSSWRVSGMNPSFQQCLEIAVSTADEFAVGRVSKFETWKEWTVATSTYKDELYEKLSAPKQYDVPPRAFNKERHKELKEIERNRLKQCVAQMPNDLLHKLRHLEVDEGENYRDGTVETPQTPLSPRSHRDDVYAGNYERSRSPRRSRSPPPIRFKASGISRITRCGNRCIDCDSEHSSDYDDADSGDDNDRGRDPPKTSYDSEDD
jgi:hypothetical protein